MEVFYKEGVPKPVQDKLQTFMCVLEVLCARAHPTGIECAIFRGLFKPLLKRETPT